ncbi:hypothetical protein H8E77_28590 [bacterium]|nr:hypothetical protein [bacterium]
MDVKEYVWDLAKKEFGEILVDIDFWGPLEGEDMMGEFVLAQYIDDDEFMKKLIAIDNKAKDAGWRICFDYTVDGVLDKRASLHENNQSAGKITTMERVASNG